MPDMSRVLADVRAIPSQLDGRESPESAPGPHRGFRRRGRCLPPPFGRWRVTGRPVWRPNDLRVLLSLDTIDHEAGHRPLACTRLASRLGVIMSSAIALQPAERRLHSYGRWHEGTLKDHRWHGFGAEPEGRA